MTSLTMERYNDNIWEYLPISIQRNIETAAKNDDWQKLVSLMESSLVTFEMIVFHICRLDLQDPLVNVLIAFKNTNLALEVLEVLPDPKAELEKKNFKGDTALHVAASMENITVSKVMLNKNPRLISITNNLRETPLHKAALHGRKDMFWELDSHRGSNIHARRYDGATVLHCAVMDHHFELALEIAERYPDLIESRDQHGLTVLHHMVTMIEVFGAGRDLNLTPIQSFFYNCIVLEKPDQKNPESDEESCRPNGDYRNVSNSMNLITGRDGLDRDKNPRNNFKDLYKNTVEKIKLLITRSMIRLSIKGLIELKKKHEFAQKLLRLIAHKSGYWTSLSLGSDKEITPEIKSENNIGERWMETPLTLGAKMGLEQSVLEILNIHPGAAKYLANDGKNILHVAVEYRQVEILEMVELSILEENAKGLKRLKDPKCLKDPRLIYWLTSTINNFGDTILHSAARPMNKTSSPLQMVEEFKWFKRVKKLVPGDLVNHRNKKGKTAQEVFSESHKEMVADGKRQLTNTARSACTALVTGIVFATGLSIANGKGDKGDKGNEDKNDKHLEKIAFSIFSHAYMVGLSSGAMALVQFMALLMSSYTEQDFRRAIPTKYFLAIVFLFFTVLSMLVAFACNTYVNLIVRSDKDWKTTISMVCEIIIFPLVCFATLSYQGVRLFGSSPCSKRSRR